ncbi:DIP2 disco-interacting protein 2 C [Mortierella antarctica]|nr:DIP2 disco-interacting protein 2 C [Mortierella antarctica]
MPHNMMPQPTFQNPIAQDAHRQRNHSPPHRVYQPELEIYPFTSRLHGTRPQFPAQAPGPGYGDPHGSRARSPIPYRSPTLSNSHPPHPPYRHTQPHPPIHGQRPHQSTQPPPAGSNACSISWRPRNPLAAGRRRPHIDAAELAGNQMLPLEPRSIPNLNDALTSAAMPMLFNNTSIVHILRSRAQTQPGALAFSTVDSKGHETGSWTWARLYGRSERISMAILDRTQLRQGARIALVFRRSEMLDFLAAYFGCLMAGMTAVPINGIEEFAEMTHILRCSNTELAFTTEHNHKVLAKDLHAHKDGAGGASGMVWPAGVHWWKTDILENTWKPKKNRLSADSVDMELPLPDLAYIEYTKSPNGELKGVAISHQTVLEQSHAINHCLGSNPRRGAQAGARSDVVISWLEPRQQVGFVLGGLLGTYRGSHTVFLHSVITDTPGLWTQCAVRYGATLALGDYEGVRNLIRYTSPLSPSTSSTISSATMGSLDDNQSVDVQNCNLPWLETFLIDATAAQPQLDREFAMEFLSPLGVHHPEHAVVPMLTLPEHGGMILSMRDHLMFPRGADKIDFGFNYDMLNGPESKHFDLTMESGLQQRLKGYPAASETICHYLLDREALKNNIIKVVATREEAVERSTERGAVLVSAFGYATPLATLAIVDPETTALSQPNTVGEIWVDSPSIAFGFWDLPKLSQSIFHALPLIVPVDTMVPEVYDPVPAGFLRTGLLGGLIEGRVVVFGLCTEKIQQEFLPDHRSSSLWRDRTWEYGHHYAKDLISTVMERIVGFSCCTVFESFINGERLPIICAESPRHQRSDLVKLTQFVRQAMLDYHGLRPYCIAIAPQGTLPRAQKNGRRMLHPPLCRKLLELGQLALSHIWTSVDDTIFNTAVGDDALGGIWGGDALAVREAVLPARSRMSQFSSCGCPNEVLDERSKVNLSQFPSLAELLVWRTITTPENAAFISLDNLGRDSKAITFRKLGMKVASIASYLEKRGGFKAGDKVVLLFPNGIDFVATVYAAWFLGLVPVPVSIPETGHLQEDIAMLMSLLTELRISHQFLIGDSTTEELMRQKATLTLIKACIGARQDAVVPTVLNVSKAPKTYKSLGRESGYSAPPRASLAKTAPAVVSVHYSTDMRRTMVKVSHATLMAQCRTFKVQCQLRSERSMVACWKSFAGLGLLQTCGAGVYVGATTVLIRYSDFMATPQIYFEAIERHAVKDPIVNYTMLEQALASQHHQSPPPCLNFSAVRNLLVGTEERVRTDVHCALERRFCLSMTDSGFYMERTSISSMFGHMVNPMITTRSYMDIEPVRLYLSLQSLRRGIVEVTTEEEDPNGIWVEDSGTSVCGTTVAIVNPETRELCLSREIGEIWVSSEGNVQAYTGTISPLLLEAETAPSLPTPNLSTSRFNATLANDDAGDDAGSDEEDEKMSFVRTGEIGFLCSYSNKYLSDGRPTSLLFVVGPIGETFEVNGLMHCPKDIEATIEKAHPNIAPHGSIVFQTESAVVCVVQVRQADTFLMNLALSVMRHVLEKHRFMPDAIAVVAEGVLAKNRYGEKQRGKMLSIFMSAKM